MTPPPEVLKVPYDSVYFMAVLRDGSLVTISNSNDTSMVCVLKIATQTYKPAQQVQTFDLLAQPPSKNTIYGITEDNMLYALSFKKNGEFEEKPLNYDVKTEQTANNDAENDYIGRILAPDNEHLIMLRLNEDVSKSGSISVSKRSKILHVPIKSSSSHKKSTIMFTAVNKIINCITAQHGIIAYSYNNEYTVYIIKYSLGEISSHQKLEVPYSGVNYKSAITGLVSWSNGRLASTCADSSMCIWKEYENVWVCESLAIDPLAVSRVHIMGNTDIDVPMLASYDSYDVIKLYRVKAKTPISTEILEGSRLYYGDCTNYGDYIFDNKLTLSIDTLWGAFEYYSQKGMPIKLYYNYMLIDINSDTFRQLLMQYLSNIVTYDRKKKQLQTIMASINAYNSEMGFTDGEAPVVRSSISGNKKKPSTTCPEYTLCAKTYTPKSRSLGRFSQLRSDCIKICEKINSNKPSMKRLAYIQANLKSTTQMQYTERLVQKLEFNKQPLATLYKAWMGAKKEYFHCSFNRFYVTHSVAQDAGGVRKQFFEAAISEIPRYLKDNGIVYWIPAQVPQPEPPPKSRSRSRSKSSDSPVAQPGLLLSCFMHRRKVAPMAKKSRQHEQQQEQEQEQQCVNPDIYLFIGELLAYGMLNDIKIGIHMSRILLQQILKPNVLPVEYVYFGMEDSIPEIRDNIIGLLLETEPYSSNAIAQFKYSEIDVSANISANQVLNTLYKYMSEMFEIEGNDNHDAFITGFTNILSKSVLVGNHVHIKNIDYLLSKQEIDPALLIKNMESQVLYLPNIEGTKEFKLLKRIILNKSVFDKFLSATTNEYITQAYVNTSTNHAVFLKKPLRYWSGMEQYTQSNQYKVALKSPLKTNIVTKEYISNTRTKVFVERIYTTQAFVAHTCYSTLDICVRLGPVEGDKIVLEQIGEAISLRDPKKQKYSMVNIATYIEISREKYDKMTDRTQRVFVQNKPDSQELFPDSRILYVEIVSEQQFVEALLSTILLAGDDFNMAGGEKKASTSVKKSTSLNFKKDFQHTQTSYIWDSNQCAPGSGK